MNTYRIIYGVVTKCEGWWGVTYFRETIDVVADSIEFTQNSTIEGTQRLVLYRHVPYTRPKSFWRKEKNFVRKEKIGTFNNVFNVTLVKEG